MQNTGGGYLAQPPEAEGSQERRVRRGISDNFLPLPAPGLAVLVPHAMTHGAPDTDSAIITDNLQ